MVMDVFWHRRWVSMIRGRELRFWDRDYVSQLPCVRYYVFVKKSFKHTRPREPMCFRCLIFSLSVPCKLLFLLCFIVSWT